MSRGAMHLMEESLKKRYYTYTLGPGQGALGATPRPPCRWQGSWGPPRGARRPPKTPTIAQRGRESPKKHATAPKMAPRRAKRPPKTPPRALQNAARQAKIIDFYCLFRCFLLSRVFGLPTN